ncbi:hypothetical protein [Streptomyces sp. CBMA152]|uniref:hypothetical protein n=1 Tax=Streptomyces sp. CBMA152 TaxID=1896312 RepID=UPI001660FEC5|nr:hypothetical protein [Streptomyces sp. CBMA152]
MAQRVGHRVKSLLGLPRLGTPELTGLTTGAELGTLCAPTTYTGMAAALVDQVREVSGQ